MVVPKVSSLKGLEQLSLLGSSYCLGNGTLIKEKCKIILLIIIKLKNYIQEERPIIAASKHEIVPLI